MAQSESPERPDRLAHALAAGATCGLLAIVQSIGVGSLIGAGAASFSSLAIGMALLATAVVAAITASQSSIAGVVGTAQSVVGVALVSMLAAVLRHVAVGADPNPTLVSALALATLAVGAAALFLGVFHLGRFIRFVPFPVVAGFMAGSGLLIVRGGLDVIAGQPIFAALASLDLGLVGRIGAGVAFIAAVLLLGRVVRTRLLLPGLVAAALAAFNVATTLGRVPATALRASRWLIALPPQPHLWPPIAPAALGQIEWGAILPALAYLPSAVVLAITALLLNATSIELDARRDIDLDNELRAVGLANLIAGVGGGVPGYHSFTLTFLGNRLGGRTRLIGLTVAAMSLAALVFGHLLLDAIPTPLLGAMLMWTGGGLLAEWLVRSYARLSLREYLVVLLIFVTIAVVGFAWGLLVGIAAALALFVVEYGRVDIVRMLVTGRDYQSSVDASEERRQNLSAHGDAILIIRLQGFLFFGTAERLRQRVERRATETAARTRFVVIDFRRVTGVDSSTVLSFIRLSQTAVRENFEIVLTGVSDASRASMARGGLEMGDDAPMRFAPDFDGGLKWCEDRLLAEAAPEYAANTPRPLTDRLADILADADLAQKVAAYCERLEVCTGASLIEQGAPSADIFFVESGHASVAIVSPGHAPVRLATVGPGAIVGEIAFYLGDTRSASVIAEQDMVVWRLSRASMDRLQAELPDVGLRFHQGVAAMLARRLTRTNHLVRLLAD